MQFKAKVGSASPSLMTTAVIYSAYGLTSTTDIDELEAFLEEHFLPGSALGIKQMIEVCVSEF